MGCAFAAAELADLERRMNRVFTLDALAADCGTAAVCNVYSCSGNPFSQTDIGGHTVWLALSATNLVLYLRHYETCKLMHPNTAACVLAPSSADASVFARMRPLKMYTQGT